jgi:hypothetical protein
VEAYRKLVRHTGKLKSPVDVIRIVCANAESELAAILAPHIGGPAGGSPGRIARK